MSVPKSVQPLVGWLGEAETGITGRLLDSFVWWWMWPIGWALVALCVASLPEFMWVSLKLTSAEQAFSKEPVFFFLFYSTRV
jgi:hypothetical protein